MPVVERLSAWLAILGGVACCGPLSEAERQRVAALPEQAMPSEPVRMQLEVEIASPRLNGTFDAVLVARPHLAAVRLQLLPPLGGPILDVVAAPEYIPGNHTVCWRIAGWMHGESTVRVWRGGPEDPPLDPLLLFGITLLEQHAPLMSESITCARAGPPLELTLDGRFPDTAVVATVDGAGRVISRAHSHRGARWRVAFPAADRAEIHAPSFTLRAKVVTRERADDLDDGVFALSAPQ